MLLLGALLVGISQINGAYIVVENVFSRGIYSLLSGGFSAVTALVPISLAEMVVWAVIVALICRLLRGLVCALKTPDKITDYWKEMFSGVVLWSGVAFIVFLMMGGLNYYRDSFVHYASLDSDFDVVPSHTEELTELCYELAAQASALSYEVERDDEGGTLLVGGFDQVVQSVNDGYAALEDSYEGVLSRGAKARAKPVGMSQIMSYGRITGMYFFFTGEANVNILAPDYTIPATTAHELAHVCGFMREDEANYIAFLTCRASQDVQTKYSGTMMALSYSLNALASSDSEAWAQVMGELSHGVNRDYFLHNRYWEQFETPVGEVAEQANDVYLRANSQEDGVKSYGRMVDLLLADYRADGVI